jgi:hypothetical protein
MPLSIPDQNVALQLRQQNNFADIGSLINTANALQQYQQNQALNPLQLEQARLSIQQAQQMNPLQVRGLQQQVEQQAAMNPLQVQRAQAEAGTAQSQEKGAALALSQKQLDAVNNTLTAVINDPRVVQAEKIGGDPDALSKMMQERGMYIGKTLGIPDDKLSDALQPYLMAAKTDNGKGLRGFLKNQLLASLDGQARINAMQPAGLAFNTGARFGVTGTNEFGATPPGSIIPGTAGYNELPPTTPVVGPNGVPGPLGATTPQPQRPMNGGASPGPAVASGLAPGQAELQAGNAQTQVQDFKSVQAEAAASPTRISLMRNARVLAENAITGSATKQREALASLGNLFDYTPSETAKNNTDLLKKELFQAINASGAANTDLGRELMKMGTPGTHMTKFALQKGLDDLIAQEQLKQFKYKYLQPVQNNPQLYQQRMSDLQNLDFHAMQFDALSPAEKKQLLSNLNKSGGLDNYRKSLSLFRQYGFPGK